MAYLHLFCRLLIGGMFAVSALAKLRDPSGFRASLRGYRLLPPAVVTPVAWAVIGAELLVVALLVADRSAPAGLLLGAALLIGFAAAMASVLRRGLDISCGCLGSADTPVRPRHLWRNAGLLTVCAAGLATDPGEAGAGEVGLLAVAAACVVATLFFLDELAYLFSPTTGRNAP